MRKIHPNYEPWLLCSHPEILADPLLWVWVNPLTASSPSYLEPPTARAEAPRTGTGLPPSPLRSGPGGALQREEVKKEGETA